MSSFWPFSGLLVGLLGTLFAAVLIRLVRRPQPLPTDHVTRVFRLLMAGVWISLWILLYMYARDLLALRMRLARLDVLWGFGALIILLLLVVVTCFALLCHRHGERFLPRGSSAKYYLGLGTTIFIFTGFLLPLGFPKIASKSLDDLTLSDLLRETTDSPAFSWAQLRFGKLSPRVLGISFDPRHTINRVVLSFISTDERSIVFVYMPEGQGDTASRRLAYRVFPRYSWLTRTGSRHSVPNFTNNEFSQVLYQLDQEGIMELVEGTMELYQTQIGSPHEWSSFSVDIGALYPSSPPDGITDTPRIADLNISVAASMSIDLDDETAVHNLYYAYLSPETLSVTGMRIARRISA